MAEVTNPLEAALRQLLQERSDLDAAIAALQKRLGQPVTVTTGLTSSGSGTSGPPQPAGEVTVYRGDFFNLSIPKAAGKLLKRIGRPLKTPEILDGLVRAEYKMKSKTPRANIYTALSRSRDFVKVLPDTWGLAEWHPEIAAAQQEAARANKPKRRGRPKRSKSKASSSVETTEPTA